MSFVSRLSAIVLLFAVVSTTFTTNSNGCLGFSMTMSASSANKGAGAKPYEKKRVAVFGTGGYLGACAFGFLQRAGSLYGTGISGIASPRAIVATANGAGALNSILSKNFVLAQADETFIKPTDMSSVDNIRAKVGGFDAAILATRYCYKSLPVTMGTFAKGPNDRTREFYMDQPRSITSRSNLEDDPGYSNDIFCNTLEACKNMGHLVVVETDAEFEAGGECTVGDKYLQLLEESQIPYTYIRPLGRMENIDNFTFKKGIQSDLKIVRANSVEEFLPVEDKKIYREHVAAVCVQALVTLGWEDNRVIQVEQALEDLPVSKKKVTPQKEWCVNSGMIMESLAAIP